MRHLSLAIERIQRQAEATREFIHGADNECFLPESTARTFDEPGRKMDALDAGNAGGASRA